MKLEQIFVNEKSQDKRGLEIQYEIQKTSWIRHPDFKDEFCVYSFKNKFELKEQTQIIFHLSADSRYELFVDGKFLAIGPNRGDKQRWYFHSYALDLKKGEHEIEIINPWYDDTSLPQGQVQISNGFIFKTENKQLINILDTGLKNSNWLVSKCPEYLYTEVDVNKKLSHVYLDVGKSYFINYKNYKREYIKPIVCENNPADFEMYAVIVTKHDLIPAVSKNQILDFIHTGQIRSSNKQENSFYTNENDELDVYEKYLKNEKMVFLKNNFYKFLIDFKDYYCGYFAMDIKSGKNTKIIISFAESLYINNEDKGNRNEICKKQFIGFQDEYILDGKDQTLKPLWWRAGRYVEVRLQTSDEDLVIQNMSLIESRYPLKPLSFISDKKNNDIDKLCLRGILNGLHETYADSPYYEQMMYVGDTRIESLITLVVSQDSMPVKNASKLLSYSRYRTGFVAERYPSNLYQSAPTFSMIWVYMIYDYLMYCPNDGHAKDMLWDLRGVLDKFETYRDDKGLLKNQDLPPWIFVDWQPNWHNGTPPKAYEDYSSSVNALYLLALVYGEKVERTVGSSLRADYILLEAKKTQSAIIDKFYSNGLLADTKDKDSFCQLTQALFLLSGLADKDIADEILSNIQKPGITECSVYSMFYLFEAFYKYDKGNLIKDKLIFWQSLVEDGLCCPIEDFLNSKSRSDCHAWGSHPSFAYRSSFAGIRPGSEFFNSVCIKPLLDNYDNLQLEYPHHLGIIKYNMSFKNQTCFGQIDLPKGLSGVFEYNQQTLNLKSGINKIEI